MLGRQRLLLATLGELRKQGKYGHTALMKTLFLLSYEYNLQGFKTYSFYPYKFGPYSSLAFGDLTYYLQHEGYLDNDEQLTPKGETEVKILKPVLTAEIVQCVSRFRNETQRVGYVYQKYPEYAIKSELVPKKAEKREPATFTIGYEGLDIDAFLNQLVQNRIDLLVDVRNNPFSMNFPFVKSRLEKHLKNAGIKYLHVPELGIESEKRKNLDSAQDYAQLFSEYEKETLPNETQVLDNIASLGKQERIALMCFEHDASSCHRGVIAKALRERGMEVTDL